MQTTLIQEIKFVGKATYKSGVRGIQFVQTDRFNRRRSSDAYTFHTFLHRIRPISKFCGVRGHMTVNFSFAEST